MADRPQASEPIRELIAGWQAGEEQLATEYGATLAAIEEAVRELEAVGARMEQRAQEQEAAIEQERAAWRQQEETSAEARKRLEHDLALSRSRVRELERHLQQRTEELLEAQSANNALAAQLQEVTDPLPVLADHDEDYAEPSAPDDSAESAEPVAAESGPSNAAPDGEESVSERFARLRNKSA